MKYLYLKLLSVFLLFALTFSAQALEIKGVKVDESTQLGNSALVLNGAGVRTKMMFKVYVAALYLEHKQSDANALLADHGSKRLTLHFVREVSAEKILHGLNEGFTDNNSAAEMTAIDVQIKAFRQMMATAKDVKNGDVIVLDLTTTGTQVSLNDKVLGKVEGEAFNQALLRVWLGANPIDASLKKALLGQ